MNGKILARIVGSDDPEKGLEAVHPMLHLSITLAKLDTFAYLLGVVLASDRVIELECATEEANRECH